MSKLKMYQWLTWSLLSINFIMLLFFLFKPKHHHHHGPEHFKKSIETELGFSTNQLKQLDIIIEKHEVVKRKKEKQIHELKKLVFESLMAETSPQKDSILSKISTIQLELDHNNYNLFIQLKQLCEKDQIEKFNVFVKKMMERRERHRKGHKH